MYGEKQIGQVNRVVIDIYASCIYIYIAVFEVIPVKIDQESGFIQQ